MANFREERLFIRVSGALDFDPNEGIDHEEFMSILESDQGTLDRPSLQEYRRAPFEAPIWVSAAEGLQTTRAVRNELEAKLESASADRKDDIHKSIQTLDVVIERLDSIDMNDLNFYFLTRDAQ